ncbi:hypothetical protein [Kineosporia sp. NBRC 101731]|uniref:YunG family protein n=1 Tax=Kineosporia sp. NBRC 101731 TaxID=3032199 RepID=UPI00249FAA49|nr:hypothetical protein [Kineosporia sp. NBRC 101731]GLY31582.1 hypothetical protein Kisp02_49470 [Kineosporia sp. NBRC 101731]
MTVFTLNDVADGLRASWAADTCSPDDVERSPWSPENPAWGHCDITALVVNDLFGGDLVMGEVHLNGEQHGYHWWNRLESGLEIDMTKEQFRLGQTISSVQVRKRPPGPLRRRREEYLLLRERLADRLGALPHEADGTQRDEQDGSQSQTS